jgi:AcrR family transcriptional regulator
MIGMPALQQPVLTRCFSDTDGHQHRVNRADHGRGPRRLRSPGDSRYRTGDPRGGQRRWPRGGGGRNVDRSRASGQHTRRRILAAAGELFSARGYEDVTIRDIAVAADADPALVIRYFKSKNDLFVLVRQPDLQLTAAPGQALTAQNVTRALVELSVAQGTRLFDVTAVGGPEATGLIQGQMEVNLVRPLMDAFGLAPAGRVHIEAIAALVVGAGFMRHRMEAPGLRALDAGQLTRLLTPAVQALLDAAARQA